MHALLLASMVPAALAGVVNYSKMNYTFPAIVVPLESKNPGREMVKIKYGPFRVPGGKEPNAMTQFTGDTGLLYNQPVVDFKKPCEDCLITGMEAGLEFVDGRVANTDKGMWLHHMVMFNEGPGRWDATCRDNAMSLPHLGVKTSPKKAERMFASGNERTQFDTTMNNTLKAGYWLSKQDKMHMIIDLMNLNDPPQQAYLTLTFETKSGDLSGWSGIKPVWLDADNCKMSDVEVPANSKTFTVSSKPWKANFAGTVLGMGAHLHDGGVNAQIVWNGNVACDSVATYEKGGMPAHKVKRDGMSDEHIAHMSYCMNNKEMKEGDDFVINGYYDLNKYPAMENINGKYSEVMAISVFYVMVPLDKTG